MSSNTFDPNSNNDSSFLSTTVTNSQSLPELSIDDVSLAEGNDEKTDFTFTVSLNEASDETVSVDYATKDGTALAGEDYTATNGTLEFAPGETEKKIAVEVIGDSEVESDETFLVNLSNSKGGVISDTQGIGTINNDDFPEIFIDDASITEGNNGNKNLTFTVSLSRAGEENITVDYATANDTAAADEDYIATSGTLEFAPGENEKTIKVEVTGDYEVEDDETFTINLSNPSGSTISDTQGIGTIQNEDEERIKVDPIFDTPISNPFGLSNVEGATHPTFADIDGDGDLDAFSTNQFGTFFFENTGSASSPSFAAAVNNPFGIPSMVGRGARIAFADIDGDEDLDAFRSSQFGTFFFENTGSASSPSFTFATPPVRSIDLSVFADIDGDGDLDAFAGGFAGQTGFFENTGSASSPSFAAPVNNPFGLSNVGSVARPTFADIDKDGDLDALVGNGDGNTSFFENTGSASSPSFAAPVNNPFGLSNVGNIASPIFADIDEDGDLDAFIGSFYGDIEFFKNLECFLTGTHILTDRGEITVEALKIGDRVKTADGKIEPIKWIGRQTITPHQVKHPLRGYPILIKAGALGDNLPHRDLYVSPDHSMFIDGLLINAGAIVNDISILKTEPTETFAYYHIELEHHSLLIAEGTAAESYLPQKENREEYDNYAEYEELYPHGSNLMLWPMDYPRISSWDTVPDFVSSKLMKIAHQLCNQDIKLRA